MAKYRDILSLDVAGEVPRIVCADVRVMDDATLDELREMIPMLSEQLLLLRRQIIDERVERSQARQRVKGRGPGFPVDYPPVPERDGA